MTPLEELILALVTAAIQESPALITAISNLLEGKPADTNQPLEPKIQKDTANLVAKLLKK